MEGATEVQSQVEPTTVSENPEEIFVHEISNGSTFSTAYYEIGIILEILIAIYLIKKVKSIRAHLIIYVLIISMNVQVTMQFFLHSKNPLLKI